MNQEQSKGQEQREGKEQSKCKAVHLVRWIVVICGLGVGNLACAATPQRVVSANLCADQLLLAFADPEQIASLSPLSGDPELSFESVRAKAFPHNRGNGEDIVSFKADLVLTGPYDSAMTRALLATQAVPFEIVAPWTDFQSGEAMMRRLAERLGHPERAEALIAKIEAQRKIARELAPRLQDIGSPNVLPLHRRGFVYHAGLTGAVMADAGLQDATQNLDLRGGGFVRLEDMLVRRPDYLIVSASNALSKTTESVSVSGPEDQGQAFLDHPALRALWPPSRRLMVPDRLSLCEGPATPALIQTLVDEIERKVLSSRAPSEARVAPQ